MCIGISTFDKVAPTSRCWGGEAFVCGKWSVPGGCLEGNDSGNASSSGVVIVITGTVAYSSAGVLEDAIGRVTVMASWRLMRSPSGKQGESGPGSPSVGKPAPSPYLSAEASSSVKYND